MPAPDFSARQRVCQLALGPSLGRAWLRGCDTLCPSEGAGDVGLFTVLVNGACGALKVPVHGRSVPGKAYIPCRMTPSCTASVANRLRHLREERTMSPGQAGIVHCDLMMVMRAG
jgi:hypothetical protein